MTIVIDINSLCIISAKINKSGTGEIKHMENLVTDAVEKLQKENEEVDDIKIKLYGDKAYDSKDCYEICNDLEAELIVPVRNNARGSNHGGGRGAALRNAAAREQLGKKGAKTIKHLNKEERLKNQSKWKKP